MSDEVKPISKRARKRAAGKILRKGLIKRREGLFRPARIGLQHRVDREPHQEECVSGPARCRSGLGDAAARCARGLRPYPGGAADQGAALRRRFARGGRPEGDCAVPESGAGAEPLSRRQCRPSAARSAGAAAGHRAHIAAARAHAFSGRCGHGIVRGRKKLRESALKSLKSFARVNLCARPPLIPSSQIQAFLLGFGLEQDDFGQNRFGFPNSGVF